MYTKIFKKMNKIKFVPLVALLFTVFLLGESTLCGFKPLPAYGAATCEEHDGTQFSGWWLADCANSGETTCSAAMCSGDTPICRHSTEGKCCCKGLVCSNNDCDGSMCGVDEFCDTTSAPCSCNTCDTAHCETDGMTICNLGQACVNCMCVDEIPSDGCTNSECYWSQLESSQVACGNNKYCNENSSTPDPDDCYCASCNDTFCDFDGMCTGGSNCIADGEGLGCHCSNCDESDCNGATCDSADGGCGRESTSSDCQCYICTETQCGWGTGSDCTANPGEFCKPNPPSSTTPINTWSLGTPPCECATVLCLDTNCGISGDDCTNNIGTGTTVCGDHDNDPTTPCECMEPADCSTIGECLGELDGTAKTGASCPPIGMAEFIIDTSNCCCKPKCTNAGYCTTPPYAGTGSIKTGGSCPPGGNPDAVAELDYCCCIPDCSGTEGCVDSGQNGTIKTGACAAGESPNVYDTCCCPDADGTFCGDGNCDIPSEDSVSCPEDCAGDPECPDGSDGDLCTSCVSTPNCVCNGGVCADSVGGGECDGAADGDSCTTCASTPNCECSAGVCVDSAGGECDGAADGDSCTTCASTPSCECSSGVCVDSAGPPSPTCDSSASPFCGDADAYCDFLVPGNVCMSFSATCMCGSP